MGTWQEGDQNPYEVMDYDCLDQFHGRGFWLYILVEAWAYGSAADKTEEDGASYVIFWKKKKNKLENDNSDIGEFGRCR